ncbi:MAG TPA: SRPBCC family protein [Verrucomicrobiae bacterium]
MANTTALRNKRQIGGGKNVKKMKVTKACTILHRSPEELYRFWRRLENLPQFSQHIVSVTPRSDTVSHWVVKAPGSKNVEWDAEVFNEHPNELIAWRSLDDSGVENAGTIRFEPAPGGRGTEVKVTLEYVPHVGKLGAFLAKLTGEEPEIQVEDDLGRFKALMEAGEIPTIDNQPVGKGQRKGKRK